MPMSAAVAGNYCGHGAFRPAQTGFSRVVGEPYVVADLIIHAGPRRDGQVRLDVEMAGLKFTGLDAGGQAQHASITQQKSYPVQERAEIVLPLLVNPDPKLPRVHEVVVR